jgi:hypothetical protein
MLADLLSKELAHQTQYKELAIIAHNAGGVLAQLAILSHDELADRVRHIFFFGPANSGVRLFDTPALSAMAPIIRLLTPSTVAHLDDLKPASPLLTDVNARWRKRFDSATGLNQYWIIGDRDQIVSFDSLAHVDSTRRFVVTGDHISVIRPSHSSRASLEIVVRALLSFQQLPQDAAAAKGLADLETQVKDEIYGVFLHGDPADRDALRLLSAQLSQKGIRVWLMEECVEVGRRKRKTHAHYADRIKAIAICIGSAGPNHTLWAQDELIAAYDGQNKPVIPVFLPSCPPGATLPASLDDFLAADLRLPDDEGFDDLVAGITGMRPVRREPKAPPAPVQPRPRLPRVARWPLVSPVRDRPVPV